jgi:predicted ATPase
MPNSNEIRRLTAKWGTGTGWPKRLEWIAINGLRGWTGQRFDMRYPIMALVGENGVGKSSIIQAAAAIYKTPGKKGRFASDFFPDTAWETIQDASIKYSILEGTKHTPEASIRKPGQRWRGNPERPERQVVYIDLSRIQPVSARVGYTKLVKAHHQEVSATLFDQYRLERFCRIMGRAYTLAKMALTNVHATRTVPVLIQDGTTYSGFHQGAGEMTIAELLQADLPQYSIVLIDEIESSLHPRSQRRLIRDLAEKCRERELQVILTTHSPYVLAELPPEARAYIMQMGHIREIIYGVSPEFAMTKMDDVPQPECDLYVEDIRAQALLTEVLVAHGPQLVERCQIIPYGAASVGKSLGQMVERNRFPRPSRVFLDGDQAQSPGCINLLGDDAPERVVFESLRAIEWKGISERVGRQFVNVADACGRAMTTNDHHDWINEAANRLILRGDTLWQAMCAEWATRLAPEEARKLVQPIDDAIIGLGHVAAEQTPPIPKQPAVMPARPTVAPTPVEGQIKPAKMVPLPLFDQVPDLPQG